MAAGWIYLEHPDTGGRSLIPDDSSVLHLMEAKGWERHVTPADLDPDAPDTGIPATPEPTERILSPAEVEELRGKALDEALTAAGLPKSGTVAEKQARLAEHEAGLADNTQEENVNG